MCTDIFYMNACDVIVILRAIVSYLKAYTCRTQISVQNELLPLADP